MAAPAPPLPIGRARLCVVLAALIWSTSGAFTKVLREHTVLGLNEPPVDPWVIAFGRVLSAGLVLLPLLRRRDVSFRPGMLPTALCFAVMNALFVRAMALGTAANAILLQYTAPLWMYLVCVGVLREPADRRGAVALAIGLAGVGVLVWGGWEGGQVPVVALALGSGVAYAGFLIGLRLLRDASPRWLTLFNHLFAAAVLVPLVWGSPLPGPGQALVLFLYGSVQMALPYWLVARGLRTVSPQEAGTLTLIEPLVNPVWAYLISPSTEAPTAYTLAGGACILGALAWRYWPFRNEAR